MAPVLLAENGLLAGLPIWAGTRPELGKDGEQPPGQEAASVGTEAAA